MRRVGDARTRRARSSASSSASIARCACTERAGRRIEGVVAGRLYVGAWLTTIVVRPDGKRRRARPLAILPDMLPADDFRRLRVLLRYGAQWPTTAQRSPSLLHLAASAAPSMTHAAFALRLPAEQIKIERHEHVRRAAVA